MRARSLGRKGTEYCLKGLQKAGSVPGFFAFCDWMGGLPQGQQELTLQGMVMIGNSQAHFSGKTHTFCLAHLNSCVFPESIYTY